MAASAELAAPGRGKFFLPGAMLGVSALAASAVYTYARNPYTPGAFPTCMFHAGTGLYCPGCGGLRATHELLHGDLLAALTLNPFVVLVVLPLIAAAAVWSLGAAWGLPWRSPRIHVAFGWIVGGIALVFTILRNIPMFAPYLAP